ncbi:pantetheine-phosphate adenylyltransferase [Schaalia sp. Marseille-Q2122]|uniref:pantetheine-phosphate adenylyltransferase n=1 Tax=Schaalia sp. Marseille-Q2122 TaxID=2736604 RepID=UPI00158CEEA7|nr:pantetheine-phosphate adenylyltransferase [Schaalia sp. Marseille-Q2122]
MSGLCEEARGKVSPRRAVFPGSFDPFTLGHYDLVARAGVLVDELIVAVGVNHAKTPLYSPEERRDMILRATADLPHVRVEIMRTPLVDFCAKHATALVIKGVRDAADAANEATQATINRELGGVETIFLPTRPELAHVSSSVVRELLRWGMDHSRYVPAEVAAFIRDNRGGQSGGH